MLCEPGDQLATSVTTYRIVRVLGRGGMGAVYLATDKNLNRPVCIKVANEEVAQDPRACERFNHEARAAAQVRHPNVVRVTMLGHLLDGSDTPFYAMEHIEGRSLKTVLTQRPQGLRIDIALHIALKILAGVDAIHERGLLHRDIKPDNILLHHDERGELVVTVIDFGIMLLLADGDTPRDSACTLTYAAPEQLRSGRLGFYTDLYQVGLVLFELLTGRRAYKEYGATLEGTIARLDIPAPPISAFSEFPPNLTKIVRKALELRPEDRYAHALDLIRDLEKIQNALVGLDLHEAVTDRGLDDELVEATATNVKTITQADLANPTDPDGGIPPWLHALRAEHKKAAVLGYAATDPGPPSGRGRSRSKRRAKAGETEPMAGAPAFINDTEPMAPAFLNETSPMPQRPLGRTPPEVTAPPKRERASKPGSQPVYVEPSPVAPAKHETPKPEAPLPPTPKPSEPSQSSSSSAERQKRSRVPQQSLSDASDELPPLVRQVLVFSIVFACMVFGGFIVLHLMGMLPQTSEASPAPARKSR